MGKGRLSGKVYDWLLTSLLTRRLKPGDRLNRRQVAEEVGVSLAPASEAMQRLEAEGFLETVGRQGTMVRQSDPEEVRGRMVLREALETQAARMYCGQPVIDQQARLLRMALSVDNSDPHMVQNWRAEIRFHSALVELTKCAVLLESFDHLMRHSLFHAVNELLPPPVSKQVRDRHQRLVHRLQTHDPDEADRIMREHIHARIKAAQPPLAGEC